MWYPLRFHPPKELHKSLQPFYISLVTRPSTQRGGSGTKYHRTPKRDFPRTIWLVPLAGKSKSKDNSETGNCCRSAFPRRDVTPSSPPMLANDASARTFHATNGPTDLYTWHRRPMNSYRLYKIRRVINTVPSIICSLRIAGRSIPNDSLRTVHTDNESSSRNLADGS
jgi:hypothetical protein